MKRITLQAYCIATVEESWTFDVPDDFDTTGTPGEVYDRTMGEEQSPEGVEFKGVENVEVDDERDREFTRLSVADIEPPKAPTGRIASNGLSAWHGCLAHNHNHCPDCRTCNCHQKD